MIYLFPPFSTAFEQTEDQRSEQLMLIIGSTPRGVLLPFHADMATGSWFLLTAASASFNAGTKVEYAERCPDSCREAKDSRRIPDVCPKRVRACTSRNLDN